MKTALNDARAVVKEARGPEEEDRGLARGTLPRRLAHRRLRRMGLRRQAGLQGRRGTRPDRRWAHRQLRRIHARRGPGGDRGARDLEPVLGPARHRHPGVGGPLRRDRRLLRAPRPDGLGRAASGLRVPTRRLRPGLPGYERGALRLRVRPRHLAAVAAPAPREHGRGRSLRRGRDQRLDRRRHHAGQPDGEDVRRRAGERGRVVLPEAPHRSTRTAPTR